MTSQHHGMDINDFPTKIWIEPTNVCNLRCRFCPHKSMKREKGMMPFDKYKRIIDQIAGREIAQLWLHHFGESTLHPDFVKMAGYAFDKGIYPIICSTNSTTLRGDFARELLLSGIDCLILSFDGASPSTYEKLRNGAAYSEVSDNIKNIFMMKKILTSPPRRLFCSASVQMKQKMKLMNTLENGLRS